MLIIGGFILVLVLLVLWLEDDNDENMRYD